MDTGVSAPTTSTKSPATRLLDLLAGWTDYVDHDEDHQLVDAALPAEQIAQLYQEAGALACEEFDLNGEADAVRAFMIERVLPLLTRAEAVDRDQARAA